MSGTTLAKRRAAARKRAEANRIEEMKKQESYQSTVTPMKEEVSTLMDEYNDTGTTDARRSEIHTQMNEKLGAIEEGSGGADTKKSLYKEFDMGNEWQAGTPEYTTLQGTSRAAATLETKTELGITAIEEGTAAAQEKYAEGEARTLSAIEAGKTGAMAEITAGEKKLGEVATAAGEQIGEAAQVGAGKMKDAYTQGMETANLELGSFAEAGRTALTEQQNLMGLGDMTQAEISAKVESTPGYQWNLEQGLKASESGAAARGGTLGGRALKELQRTGAGIASGTFDKTISQLGEVSGRGQMAATALGQVAMQGAAGIAGAERFGATGEMAGTEFGAKGMMAATQYGSAGRAGIIQGATSQEVGAIGSTTAAMAGADIMKATSVSNIYGMQATAGAQIEMTGAQNIAQMEGQRMEAQLAKDMARWQNSSSMFGSLMGLAGTAVGAYLGGPVGAGIGAKVAGGA